MPTYTTAVQSVNLEKTLETLETMSRQLADLVARLQAAGLRMFPRADLCDGCDDFKTNCLTVDEFDTLGQAQTFCGDCRKEAR